MTKSTSAKDVKQALLDSAATLFNAKGYQAVSTRDIAEAAGVNLGLIQYYFGSKAKLFIETVQTMMRSNPCLKAGLVTDDCPECPVQCADELCEFVYAYLEYLLRPEGVQPCKLMYRELNNETANDQKLCSALVEAVSDDFLRPIQTTLTEILAVLAPKLSPEERSLHAFCIMGQCSFYSVHRPIVENMWKADLSSSPLVEELGTHISRFSLQAIGAPQPVIEAAVERVFKKKLPGKASSKNRVS